MPPINCPRCGAEAPDDARFCQVCGAAMGEGDGDLVGKVVARKYKVIDGIGEGSMGRIYLAEHLGLEKRVALKVLHREVVLGPEGLQRFRREGVAAGKLSHPNAIEVFDFDVTESGDAFLAMEFVEGRDLRKVLEEDGAFDLDTARDVVLQALDALEAAHGHGIVHRDLKPENIMVVDGPSGPRVKVLDFGLSKLVDTRIEASLATVPGRVIGTPFYMAPEQSSGEEADARTDLYAMGIIFYELLAGQRPFTGRNLTELLYAQATKDVPSINELPEVSGLPQWVDEFIERALGRDREDRYQSAGEMAQDLREGVVQDAGTPRRPREVQPSSARRAPSGSAAGGAGAGRPAWVVPAAIVAVLLAIASVVVFGLGGGSMDDGSDGTTAGGESTRVRAKAVADRNEADKAYLRLLDTARQQVQAGNVERAEGSMDAVFSSPKLDAEAYFLRGSIDFAKGDVDSAASNLRTACDRDPAYTEARALYGWVELERGRTDEALALFDEALDQDGACADALAGRATILLERGETDEARRLVETAAADRDSWRAQLAVADLALSTGDTQTAIDAFVEAKRVHPRSRDALIGLARTYLAADRGEDAIQQYRALLANDPADPEAVRGLAAVQLDLGRFRAALDTLEPLLEQGDAAAADRALAGVAHHGLGDTGAARDELERALDDGLADARPKVLLASIQLADGDADQALRSAESALEDDYERAEAHLVCGLALFRLERYEEAAAVLRRTVELDRECAQAWLVLGALGVDYLRDGAAKAQTDLETYLEVGGTDPRAAQWLSELAER